MAIGSAFPSSGIERVPAGKTKIILQAITEDNQNLNTAKWTVASSGRSYNVQAAADGRAELTVDAGFTYTITPSVTGTYDGVNPQTLIAESTQAVLSIFKFTTPRALDSNTVHKSGAETITGPKTFQKIQVPAAHTSTDALNLQDADNRYLGRNSTAEKARADDQGHNIRNTYATKRDLSDGLSGKQNTGNYAYRSDLNNYATKAQLNNGLAGKQPNGDYATKTELSTGLAGKQNSGDYATKTELNGKMDNSRIKVSTSGPSGGKDGDIWIQV